MNKVKNLGYDRCLDINNLGKNQQKCVTQIYRALYGDAMCVPF